jgi:hypothetical protein
MSHRLHDTMDLLGPAGLFGGGSPSGAFLD